MNQYFKWDESDSKNNCTNEKIKSLRFHCYFLFLVIFHLKIIQKTLNKHLNHKKIAKPNTNAMFRLISMMK